MTKPTREKLKLMLIGLIMIGCTIILAIIFPNPNDVRRPTGEIGTTYGYIEEGQYTHVVLPLGAEGATYEAVRNPGTIYSMIAPLENGPDDYKQQLFSPNEYRHTSDMLYYPFGEGSDTVLIAPYERKESGDLIFPVKSPKEGYIYQFKHYQGGAIVPSATITSTVSGRILWGTSETSFPNYSYDGQSVAIEAGITLTLPSYQFFENIAEAFYLEFVPDNYTKPFIWTVSDLKFGG